MFKPWNYGFNGFNGFNPRECWQMKLSYQELFNSPKFDSYEMLAARRSTDHEASTKYIEKMVHLSKYRKIHRADISFSQVRSRIYWDRSKIP